MADRLINENDVLALIDSQIDALDRLLANPQCRGMNRQLVASNIGALRKLSDHVKFLPESNLTDSDIEAMAAVEFGYRQCEKGNNLQAALGAAASCLG